jgi:hypothetical protein
MSSRFMLAKFMETSQDEQSDKKFEGDVPFDASRTGNQSIQTKTSCDSSTASEISLDRALENLSNPKDIFFDRPVVNTGNRSFVLPNKKEVPNQQKLITDSDIHLNIFSNYPSYTPEELPLDAHLQFLKISAVGTAASTDARPVALFSVEVRSINAMPNSWIVYRRYADFCILRQSLMKELPTIQFAELPPKETHFSVDILINRMKQLDQWLSDLLHYHERFPGSSNVYRSQMMHDFLIDDYNRIPRRYNQLYSVARTTDAVLQDSPSSNTKVKQTILNIFLFHFYNDSTQIFILGEFR